MYKKTNYDFSVLISRLKAINFSIAKADLERAIKNQLPRMLENLSLVFLCKHNPAWKHWQGEVIGNISSYNGKTKKGNHQPRRRATGYGVLIRYCNRI